MKKAIYSSIAALLIVSPIASANWAVNVGPIHVAPSESSGHLDVIESVAGLPTNSTALAVNNNNQLGLTVDYKFTPNWALQVVAATPFSHDIAVAGSAIDGLAVGNTKHLPPTLLAQYHFTQFGDRWQPFIGVGVNYTTFFDTKVDPQLTGALTDLAVITAANEVELSLSDSWGLALQAGVNVQLTPTLGLHAMLSRIDIATTGRVNVDGATIQQVAVDIDPVVAMVGLRWLF